MHPLCYVLFYSQSVPCPVDGRWIEQARLGVGPRPFFKGFAQMSTPECGTLARSGCMCRRALRSPRPPGDRAATTAAAELASCYRWAGVHAQNARACSPLAGPAFQPPTAQPWSFMLAKNPLPGLRALALANVLTVLKLSTLYSMCAQCVYIIFCAKN